MRFNRFQPAIIHQEHPPARTSPPQQDSYYSSQKVYAPQPVQVARPQFQAALPSPPLTPYGYSVPDARYHRHQQHQQHYHQQHNYVNAPPTPPSTPPPTAFEQAQYLDPTQRLEFLRTLGSGAYGVVHLAKDVLTGIQYAVKVLNKFTADGFPLDARQQHFQNTEMRLHYEVSAHPNVVSLLRIIDRQDCTYVVMEYCPEGDLFLNITEHNRYVGNDRAAKDVFLQILDAVAHCHRHGVYHRDLKPENILVSEGGNQVKLADFGLATTDSYSSDFGCGSTMYMSPGSLSSSFSFQPPGRSLTTIDPTECQHQNPGMPYYASAPNDVWSLGVILVNLTCGRNPWKSASPKESTFRAFMENRSFLKSILPLSDELNEILGMIFELDPSRRISLDELRQRVIDCPVFTTTPAKAEPIVVVTDVDEDHFDDHAVYSPASASSLSPASTVFDSGSMVSDSSNDSVFSSEPDTQSQAEPVFDVKEDDELCYDDFKPTVELEKDSGLAFSFFDVNPPYHYVSPFESHGLGSIFRDNQVVLAH